MVWADIDLGQPFRIGMAQLGKVEDNNNKKHTRKYHSIDGSMTSGRGGMFQDEDLPVCPFPTPGTTTRGFGVCGGIHWEDTALESEDV